MKARLLAAVAAAMLPAGALSLAAPSAPAALAQPRAGQLGLGTAVNRDGRRPAVPAAKIKDAAAVSIWGSTLVVGAYSVHPDRGAAYVYQRSASGWHPTATIHDPDPGGPRYFGFAVAVSGSTVLIGAPGVRNGRGAAFVYVFSGGRWRHQATLPAPGGGHDAFGWSVALSGSTAIIGGLTANNGAGGAYVYIRSGSAWSLRASLAGPAGGSFGESVRIEPGIAVVAAPDAHNHRGALYVYGRSPSGWRQQQVITDLAGAELGAAAAISAGTVVFSALDQAEDGPVYVYARAGSRWRHQATLTDPVRSPDSAFGVGVAVSGDRLLIGKPYLGITSQCGLVYEYTRHGAKWRETEVIKDPHCTAEARFGYFLALSGRTSVIGAISGDVYQLTVR